MRDASTIARQLVRPQIKSLTAYQVQNAHGLIKLDVMENPYDWPDAMKDKWLQRLKSVPINRYPSPDANKIKAQLLAPLGLGNEIDVLFGNGSDELIAIIMQTLVTDQGPVMSVRPSFSMYKILAQVNGHDFQEQALNDDFSLPIDALVVQIQQQKPVCTFISYPNNPTGNLFKTSDMRQIIEASQGLVVVDEAYLPFAERTLINWLGDYPNLLVMRTLSKAGLAGLRFGMLFGHKSWLHEFNKLRLPFNINALTQASVEFALEHTDQLKAQAQGVVSERNRVFAILSRYKQLNLYPSDANFITFKVLTKPATQVFDDLLQRKILIKCLHKVDSLLDDCLRLTIGTATENDQFLAALDEILNLPG